MLSQYFTFDEFQKEYNIQLATKEIKLRVKGAYNRKKYILPAYKKGQTYYQFVSKEEVENWLLEPKSSYLDGNNYKELLAHYGLASLTTTKKDFISFMANRGIEVKLNDTKNPKQFIVLNDDIFYYDWVPYINDNNYEVCKEGLVRSAEKKRLCGSTSARDGYVIINNSYNNQGQYTAHRMIKETFDPIENSKNFVVDHINGIRNDNRLENLRWCYQAQNIAYKEENLTSIKELLPKCIQKYGYKEFEKILADLL